MTDNSEGVGLNHPDYDHFRDMWRFIRDSIEGEEQIKEYAVERGYLLVPAAMSGDGDVPWHYRKVNREANAYIERARYPEVVLRAIDMASGKAMSRDPQIKASPEIAVILDDIWVNGDDFETGVMRILREALSTRFGGLLPTRNDEGDPVLSFYPAENVVNWKHERRAQKLLVLEDSVPNENMFSHEVGRARLVMYLNEDGNYTVKRYVEEAQLDEKGKHTGMEWVESGEAVTPTVDFRELESIPFIPIGGYDIPTPPFMPLARTARDYFQCSAEFNHIMFLNAVPQMYINFDDTGNFFGMDEFSAAALQAEGAATEPGGRSEIELTIGSSTPWLFRGATVNYVQVPSGALGAHEKRLEKLSKEMSGLGARAFQNEAGGGQKTAETERLQQAGEGAVVWLVLREVAKAITEGVRTIARWRKLRGADEFEFAFNRDINFEPFDFNPVSGMIQAHQEGYARWEDVIRVLRKVDAIEPGISDDELKAAIEEERSALGGGFGDFDGGGDDFTGFDEGPDPEADEDEPEQDDGDEDDLDEAA